VFAHPAPKEDSMVKSLALLFSCLALALVPAGCGDDEEESGGGGGQAQPEQGGGKATEVTMDQIQFKPASVTVEKGGKVTWTNDESVGHDVTKKGGPGPDFKSGESGGMSEGDTFSHTFDAPGKVDYVCTVHPNMKGTVTVR
jgi:plastocyanin